MEPINYMLNVPDPAARVFEGYAQGLDAQAAQQKMGINAAQEARAAEMQPLNVQAAQLGLQQGEANLQATQADMQAQQQAAQRRDQFYSAMGDLASLGGEITISDLQSVVGQFPEYSESILGTYETLGAARQESVDRLMGQAAFALKSGNVDAANTLMAQYVAAAENSDDPALLATAQGIQQIAQTDPNAALAAIGSALYTTNPQLAGQIFEQGTVRASSFTPIGVRGAAIVNYSDGTRGFKDAAGNEYPPEQVPALIQEELAFEVQQVGDVSSARTGATQENRLVYARPIASETTIGRIEGEVTAQRTADAPQVVQKTTSNIDLIDSIINDPNLESVLGPIQGRLPPDAPMIGGGQAGADLGAKIQQLQGAVFLQAFESLKGGGTITEVEGLKAEQSLARLQRTQSPEAFRAGLMELRMILEAAQQRAQGVLVPDVTTGEPFVARAQQETAPAQPAPAQPAQGEFDDLFSTYGGGN